MIVLDNRTGIINILNSNGLPIGASVNTTATYLVTQADLDNGSVTNLANVTSSYDNELVILVTSNNSSVTVPAIQTPALNITKSANITNYDHVGQVIGYNYTINNAGNVNLTAPFTVTDNLTTVGYTATTELQPGQNFTGTATYIIHTIKIMIMVL